MTSPPERITVQCPQCGGQFEDWYRASLNLAIEDFDESYIEEAGSATCPTCKHTIKLDTLIVREEDGVWLMEGGEHA